MRLLPMGTKRIRRTEEEMKLGKATAFGKFELCNILHKFVHPSQVKSFFNSVSSPICVVEKNLEKNSLAPVTRFILTNSDICLCIY